MALARGQFAKNRRSRRAPFSRVLHRLDAAPRAPIGGGAIRHLGLLTRPVDLASVTEREPGQHLHRGGHDAGRLRMESTAGGRVTHKTSRSSATVRKMFCV